MRKRLVTALAALPLAAVTLTGCGLFGPATYEPTERSIEVDAGDEFTLSLPASPGLGQSWSLVRPHPDSTVVKRVGEREEVEGSDLDGGADGTQFIDFKAVKPGTTKIKLIHCIHGRCATTEDNPDPHPTGSGAGPVPTATGTPGNEPEYFIYTVTVR
ncbi:protease inhibitor I42 family protein [Streptomyces sp. NPDC002851]